MNNQVGKGCCWFEIRTEHCREDINEDRLSVACKPLLGERALCIPDSMDRKTAHIPRQRYWFMKAKY